MNYGQITIKVKICDRARVKRKAVAKKDSSKLCGVQ